MTSCPRWVSQIHGIRRRAGRRSRRTSRSRGHRKKQRLHPHLRRESETTATGDGAGDGAPSLHHRPRDPHLPRFRPMSPAQNDNTCAVRRPTALPGASRFALSIPATHSATRARHFPTLYESSYRVSNKKSDMYRNFLFFTCIIVTQWIPTTQRIFLRHALFHFPPPLSRPPVLYPSKILVVSQYSSKPAFASD